MNFFGQFYRQADPKAPDQRWRFAWEILPFALAVFSAGFAWGWAPYAVGEALGIAPSAQYRVWLYFRGTQFVLGWTPGLLSGFWATRSPFPSSGDLRILIAVVMTLTAPLFISFVMFLVIR